MEMATPKRKYKKHKQGYTVTVDHFLRKDKNFLEKVFSRDEVQEDGSLLLPVYVRIIFLQKSTTIRSRIKVQLTEAEFDSYVARPDVAKFLEYELAAIRYSINEFQPHVLKNFTMNQWSSQYNSYNVPIKEAVEDIIGNKLFADHKGVDYRKSIEEGFDFNRNEEWLLNGASSFDSLINMAESGLPIAKKFVSLYEPLFKMEEVEGRANEVMTFNVWDWKTGSYQDYVRECNTPQMADAYLNLLESVLNDFHV